MISALAMTAAMIPPPSVAPVAAAPLSISRSARLIAARTPLFGATPERLATPAPPRRDSLKNGAMTGAIIGGSAMALFASRTCRETSCAPDVLLWTGIAAGLGAAAGAGIDALFDRH